MLVIKGFIIGIAKIIPGVSGAVLAISLGVYDRGLKAITGFFDDVKGNSKFLLPLGIGLIISFIVGSKMVLFLLDNFYGPTMFLFIGLIMGGIPSIYSNCCHKRSGCLIFVFSLLLVLFLNTFSEGNSYVMRNDYLDLIIFMLSGLIDAFGTIIPGLSSTALLMLFGSYYIIMNSFSHLDLFILTYYGIGMLLGLVLVSYLMNYLFCKYRKKTFSLILGLIGGSMMVLISRSIGSVKGIYEFVLCIVLLFMGVFVGMIFDK